MKAIYIENLAGLKLAYEKAPLEMENGIEGGIRDVVHTLENKAKREVPVGKVRGGNLRQSIRSYFPKRFEGVVTAGAKYAGYVHDGTRPHLIRVSTKKALANKRTGQIFGKVVKHPGTKENPFFTRAIDSSNYPAVFNNHITRVLRNIV